MNVLHPSEQLIQEELMMFWCKIIVRFYDLMEIRLHQFKDYIDVLEFPPRRRKHNVLDLNYVWVPQQPEQLDLPKDAGGVGDVIKDVNNLLDSHALTSLGVDGSGHNTVAPFANDLADLIAACLAILCEEVRLLRESKCPQVSTSTGP